MGGFDLCFGRWDTPQHSLVDDRPKGFEHIESAFLYGLQGDVEDYQIWPGKGAQKVCIACATLMFGLQTIQTSATLTSST